MWYTTGECHQAFNLYMSAEIASKIQPTPKAPAPVEQAVASWKKSHDEDRKKHWEKVFQVGEHSPYQERTMQWDAFREAWHESIERPGDFLKNFGAHVHKVDTELRGGKDYGTAKERMERVASYAGMVALFTAFDYATSKPFEKFFKLHKGPNLHPEDMRYNARMGAIKKIVEVMNDKYATALGNMVVQKLSGKRGYIHEVADKGADTLQVGWDEFNDLVNGATLESYMRILFQIPVAGALFEKLVTKVSMWQEKSSLHTATGKMLYMGLGVFIRDNRKAGKMDEEFMANLLARTIA